MPEMKKDRCAIKKMNKKIRDVQKALINEKWMQDIREMQKKDPNQ